MDGPRRIPLAEEEFAVGIEEKTTGRVRVKTVTRAVEDRATAELESSEISMERIPIGRAVEHAPEIRVEGDVTIIPVLEEVLVVEKRLVLKEEIRLTRRRVHERVEVPVTLRKQEAVVERDVVTPKKG